MFDNILLVVCAMCLAIVSTIIYVPEVLGIVGLAVVTGAAIAALVFELGFLK